MSSDLPPTYTQEPSETDVQVSDDSDHSFVSAPDGTEAECAAPTGSEGPQILIIPIADGSVHFQKGYLGADNERAAIEGELQIKSAEADFRWLITRAPLSKTLSRAVRPQPEPRSGGI